MLLNIVDNALKFTPVNGSVTLLAAYNKEDEVVLIEIRDTGKGIPPEDLPHVFDRFYRVDPSRSRLSERVGGSGLGLAIVRAIVEAHGGRIWAENAAGAGARFIFTLPLSVSGQAALTDEITLRLPRK